MNNHDYLRQISIFSELEGEFLEKIYQISRVRKYKKGRIIFMEGEPGEAFFYIKSGLVKISKLSRDGREHILHVLNEGHVFAEVTLFSNTEYPATAEVLEDAEIGIIKNEDLEKVIKENPDLSLQLIKYLNKRLVEAHMKIRNLALYDTYERTAQALVKLAEDYGKKSSKGVNLDINISRQELANIVGTTRETVIRALTAFKKEHLIGIEKNTITIIDLESLKEWPY
ncbi:MAG TPA: Crp/Fnr family transcriptional regulator [Bacillota bacterium]|nr:Crp/Fnr family transcriptional regulator [Clostridiaceae bacterium]HNR04953.1 Crp/Fnr family transcriptional regulator [Bacillota bacterium]HNT02868.1 Crp/Fnr family transcriptional regulator [Bacillota bacterium]HPA54865.1 Crp/Fnr family transcriptional regulator [Bacillota bacterium]HPX69262.1 Crp/Fnr family transcriptional regulator [Bacillota bacterium]